MIDARYVAEDGVTYLKVPLDDATFAWLVELSEHCHVEPRLLVAAILRDVKNDDETAHLCEPAPSGGGVTLQ